MRFGIILSVIVCSAAFGQKQDMAFGSPVLFSISESPVTTDEFIYLYKKNHLQSSDFSEEKINEYLNLFINFKLKIAEAKHRGLDTTRAFAKEFNQYKEELKKPYQANADDLTRLTKEAYEHMLTEVKATHILIMVKVDANPGDTLAAYRKASALRQRAIAGEDFGKLATEFSEDPSAKTNGGMLGYFTALQMVYPFEEAAFKTKTGEISEITRTRFGYHIIKVLDRRSATGEVEVSHILLRSDKSNSAKIKNSIFEIYDQLKGGRSWEEVCKEFSDDTNTKNQGGRLRPFGTGAFAAVPEFEQVAFSLKQSGDISDPFQSSVGWHIIRLEKKIPLPPFKEMETGLKRRVARDERVSISKASLLEKRKKEQGFVEDQDTKAKVMALADSSLVQGKWNAHKGEELKGLLLFSLGSKKIMTEQFLHSISEAKPMNGISPSSYMKQLYDKFVEERINEIEEAKLLKENPDYRMLLNEYREGILLFEIMEKEVWNRASEDSIGQRKFYSQHPEKFKAGNRVEARIFATNDKAFLEQMRTKIAAGDTLQPGELKKFTSITNKKIFKAKESSVIDQISWVQGVQETEVNGTFYLVEVIRLIPPGIQSFEEARASVISDYQDSLEKGWVSALRKKYQVKINKEGKRIVISELKK